MNNLFCILLLSAIYQGVINVKFEIEPNRKITRKENTTDIYQYTLVGCAWLCFYDKKCRTASFNMEKSICRLDFTDQCCVGTEKSDTWNLIRNCVYSKFCLIFLINKKGNSIILILSNTKSAMLDILQNNYIYF